MKKTVYRLALLTTILVGITISSCSTDDNQDTPTSKQELLIGKWQRFKSGIICSSKNKSSEEFSSCKKKGTITFKSDGTYVDIPYFFFKGNCIIDAEYTGTWKIINGELYTKHNNNGTSEKTAFFEISENTLRIGHEGTNCESEDSNSIRYIEFVKM